MIILEELISGQQTLDEGGGLVGVVISKLERHRNGPLRGYIAMLAVKEEYRGNGIGMFTNFPSERRSRSLNRGCPILL